MAGESRPFGDPFAEPIRTGLTRPKAVRGDAVKMMNMSEISAYPRIRTRRWIAGLPSAPERLYAALDPIVALIRRCSAAYTVIRNTGYLRAQSLTFSDTYRLSR